MALSAIRDECVEMESDYAHAVRVNPALVRAMVPNPRRERFFRLIKNHPFDRVARTLLRPTARTVLNAVLDRCVAVVPAGLRDTPAARLAKRVLGIHPAPSRKGPFA